MLSTILILALPALLILLYIIYKPPTALITTMQHLYPDVIFHIPQSTATSRKLVALTIDDGPSQHTSDILSILRAHGAKATMFLIGWHIPACKEVLRDALRDGSGIVELANHGLYDEPAFKLSIAELKQQIELTQSMIDGVYGDQASSPRYYRPGSGLFTASMRKLVRDLGYKLFLGDVYPHDAFISSAWLNARHVLSMIRPGSVIIVHDGRKWTAPMLKMVLPEIRRIGYEVVTLTELMQHASS